MTYNNILCVGCLLCVFASTVRFLGNNPAAGTGSGAGGWLVVSHRVTAVIASRKRPVPFRTRKLSSIAPMVLHSGGCGRVGRRRTSFIGSGGVLEPRQGVRLHHSLWSCPKPDTPVRGCSGEHRERGEPRLHRRGSPRIICSVRRGAGRAAALSQFPRSPRGPSGRYGIAPPR